MAPAVAVATMEAAQIAMSDSGFEIVERGITKLGAVDIQIKVHMCGVCHSDTLTVEGSWSEIQYLRAQRYEIAGIIDAAEAGVSMKTMRVAGVIAV